MATKGDSQDIHIEGPKDAIERIIKTAARFTDQSTGAPTYLKCILIEATADTITVTAESAMVGAIQIIRDTGDISVLSPGTIMVQSSWLLTALSITNPDAPVSIKYDSKQKRLTVINGEQEVDLTLPEVDVRGLKPSIGTPNTKNGISFSPDKFADTYNSASAARDSFGRHPVMAGVLMESSKKDGLVRMMSSDGSAMQATDAVEVEFIGEGLQSILLQDSSVRQALDYLKEGERAEFFIETVGADKFRLHALARGKGGSTPYHIRLTTHDHDLNNYPASRLRPQLQKFASLSYVNVKMEKAELQRILRSASSIGSLDMTNFGGQAKKIVLNLSEDAITASVNTSASYEGSAYAEITPASGSAFDIAEGLSFGFKFGLYGHLVDAYHNEEDPKNIEFSILAMNGQPKAIMFFKGSVYQEDGSTPAEYLSLTSLSAE